MAPVITVGEIIQCREVKRFDVNRQAKWSVYFEMYSSESDLSLLCSFLLNCFKLCFFFSPCPPQQE